MELGGLKYIINMNVTSDEICMGMNYKDSEVRVSTNETRDYDEV